MITNVNNSDLATVKVITVGDYCSVTPGVLHFPRGRYQGLSPVGLAEIQEGVTALDVDLHTDTNNFAPNEYIGVVNPSGLAVYKGSTQEIIIVSTKSKD